MLAVILAAAAAHSPIFHYVRSNRDGSLREHVVHYRPSRREISVYKWVSKCTVSAYVTARMNREVRSGELFVAGKVARDGSQARFGTLTTDPAGRALLADVTPPGAPRITARHPLRGGAFLLYDFDFADPNAYLQEHRPRGSFDFELVVIWPGKDGIFRDLGKLHASYAGQETRLKRQARRFDVRVNGSDVGKLWIDSRDSFIVEASLSIPNHQEYRDFRLQLERVQPGGTPAWNALTASQYAGCPVGK